MDKYSVAVLAGDGIGEEVTREAVKVLKVVGQKLNLEFEFKEALIGGCAYEKYRTPLPQDTIDLARSCNAILLGAVGDFKYDNLPPESRPEQALLKIRKEFNLFANLRPAIVHEELASASTLKPEVVSGVNLMIIRELTGDVYFGEPKGVEVVDGRRAGFNNMIYFEDEIERIAHVAFKTAMKRDKRLCSVDKANVLSSSRLWREIMIEKSKKYPDIELSHMYIDNAAMQLIKNPKQFDVIVTGNIFGDILSDEASMLTGSLGMLPSASLTNGSNFGMYEPIHGSAPDIKGMNIVNPIATILSCAMMCKYSFSNDSASTLIENAVKKVLKEGYRTKDIFTENIDCPTKLINTDKMGDLIALNI